MQARSHIAALVATNPAVLKQIIHGTISAGRALNTLTDRELESIVCSTVEGMSCSDLARLAEVAKQMWQSLSDESIRRGEIDPQA